MWGQFEIILLRLHFFDQKYSRIRNIVKYYYNLKELFSMWIYCKMYFITVIKAVFSSSLLQSSVSHDPSEIILIYWFAPQETFVIIINVILNIDYYDYHFYHCFNIYYYNMVLHVFGETIIYRERERVNILLNNYYKILFIYLFFSATFQLLHFFYTIYICIKAFEQKTAGFL